MFEQKYERYQSFLADFFLFLEVKFSLNVNRRVFLRFLMISTLGKIFSGRHFDVFLSFLGNRIWHVILIVSISDGDNLSSIFRLLNFSRFSLQILLTIRMSFWLTSGTRNCCK